MTIEERHKENKITIGFIIDGIRFRRERGISEQAICKWVTTSLVSSVQGNPIYQKQFLAELAISAILMLEEQQRKDEVTP